MYSDLQLILYNFPDQYPIWASY
uniref:Uncharacterized protein n=1 Tax=Arundo donax TaxID=35708 RepID=A0A0A9HFN6_ARUDO